MQIKSFPSDDRMWRINWLGYITPGTYERSLTEIAVALSPILDPNLPRFAKETTAYEVKKPCISIGHLPFLNIGSAWKNGQLVENDQIPSETATFQVSSPNIPIFVEASKLIHQKRYWMDKLCGDTQCLVLNNVKMIDTSDKRKKINCLKEVRYKLIIPCPEIARFYFATSSTLIRKLIHGAAILLDNLAVFYDNKDKCRTGALRDKELYLTLHRLMLDSDAWVIARIIGDPIARREAERLYKSLLGQQALKKAWLNPQVSLPFSNQSNLKFKGFLTRTVDNEFAFVALNILSCTGQFPYDTLIIDRQNSNRVRNHNGEKMMGYRKTYYKAVNNSEGEIVSAIGKEPSKQFLKTEIYIQEERFLQLKKKKIIKRYKMNAEYKSRGKNIEGKEVEGYESGVGDPRKSAIAPIDIIVDADNINSRKELIRQSLLTILWQSMNQLIRRGCRCNVVVVETGERTKQFQTSTFPFQYSKWATIHDGDEQRGRQALWLEFEKSGIWSYVVEWERRGVAFGLCFLRLNNGSRATNEELTLVMNLWSSDQKNRQVEGLKNRGWIRKTIPHPDDDEPLTKWPKIIADRIYGRLFEK